MSLNLEIGTSACFLICFLSIYLLWLIGGDRKEGRDIRNIHLSHFSQNHICRKGRQQKKKKEKISPSFTDKNLSRLANFTVLYQQRG